MADILLEIDGIEVELIIQGHQAIFHASEMIAPDVVQQAAIAAEELMLVRAASVREWLWVSQGRPAPASRKRTALWPIWVGAGMVIGLGVARWTA